MSSLIKPSSGGGTTQNSSVPTPLNKPSSLHQGPPQSYGQPSTNHHTMVSHGGNPTAAHNHPSSNHYSPNTFAGNAQNQSSPPSSNHPITSTNHSQTSTQSPAVCGGAKNMTFQGGFQPNLGHQNQVIPQVSQVLPASTEQVTHSNGTNEEKPQKNHVETKQATPGTAPKQETPEKQTTPSKTPENSPGLKTQAEPQKSTMVSPSGAVVAEATTEKNENETEKGENEVNDEDDDEDNEMDIETEINENNEIKENKVIDKVTPPAPPAKVRAPASRKSKEESPKRTESKPSTSQKSPSSRSKRARIRTQHYQSPLPEIEIISKLSAVSHLQQNRNKNDDKLTVFFKNEFLAVRNSEGSFYVCQAVQNIYRSSSKIKIRWLSQNDKNGEIYTPDFYDHTEFDCILTNLNLEKIEKGKFRLPPAEKERTDSILKRSLAAEKGEEISSPSVTEEHPDGLDLSLYKDEMQLNKSSKSKKRKAATSPQRTTKSGRISATNSPASSSETPKTSRKTVQNKPVPKKSSVSRTERAKRRNDNNSVKVSTASTKVDQKKAKALAKVARKPSSSTKQVAKKAKPVEATKTTTTTQKTKVKPAAKVSTKKKTAKKSKKKLTT